MNCDKQKLTPPVEVKTTKIYRQLYNLLVRFFQKNDYSDFISEMLNIKDETLYQEFYQKVTKFISSVKLDGVRIVISDPDGQVIVDTSKGDVNTYQNSVDGTINVNHNTRQSFMSAQMHENGVSFETKYSNSTQQSRAYVSMRLGNFRDNAGTICISSPHDLGENRTVAPVLLKKC